jgi:hypothetical protein
MVVNTEIPLLKFSRPKSKKTKQAIFVACFVV